MKPSSALIIGGAYLSYTIASWSPERREAVVEMIRDGVSGAINAFLEDPVGCLRRFWDEKKRSPMLLLALASKLMADNLRRKRLKREAAAAPADAFISMSRRSGPFFVGGGGSPSGLSPSAPSAPSVAIG